MPSKRKKKMHRLESASLAQRREWVVPTRLLNTVIAVFLLPLVFVWSRTFFTLFGRETMHHHYWATEEFWFFCLGAVLWGVVFFGIPRWLTLRAYVWGHEATHAVWVWMMGGRVSEFKVYDDNSGGHIMTNKRNVLVALSPYFYPIYSIFVLFLYAVGGMFWDMSAPAVTRGLFVALGLTWTFHISFTLWMIPKGQTDLSRHGTFFSLVIIYLANLALFSALVILTAPKITLNGFGQEFLHQCIVLSRWIITNLQG